MVVDLRTNRVDVHTKYTRTKLCMRNSCNLTLACPEGRNLETISRIWRRFAVVVGSTSLLTVLLTRSAPSWGDVHPHSDAPPQPRPFDLLA